MIEVRRQAAAALTLRWPDRAVSYATLRALTQPSGYENSKGLTKFLHLAQQRGDVTCGTVFVGVERPDALLNLATAGMSDWTIRDLLPRLDDAVAAVAERVAAERHPGMRARRQAELEVLQALARPEPGERLRELFGSEHLARQS